MPLYLFETENGQIVEEAYHMSDAPSIGTVVVLSDGRRGKRIVSPHRFSKDDTQRKFPRYPYASHALPRWTRPKGMDDLEFDKKGKPIIKSAKQEREYAARRNMVKH